MKKRIKRKGLPRVASLLRVLALVGVVMTAATSHAQSDIRINGGSVTAIGGQGGGDAMGGDNLPINKQSYITVEAGATEESAQIYQDDQTLTEWLKGKAYANFELTKYPVTVNINNSGWGVVSINGEIVTSNTPCNYTYGTKLTIKAIPSGSEQYVFAGWYDVNDNLITESVNMPDTVVRCAMNLKAKFSDEVTISLNAVPEGLGTVEFIQGGKTVKVGSIVIVKATPQPQNAFNGWYNTANPDMACGKYTYEFKATANVSLEARFTDQVIWVRVKKGNTGN